MNLLAATGGGWLRTIGRLRPGVTAAHAAQEIATGASAASGRSTGPAALEPLYTSRTGRAVALLWSNLVGLRRESRLALWLAGGAFLLLLLACANVAGLLSMRGIDRRREIAVRLQLGASRFRVFRQLLCEHLVIAVLGGAVAILVAVLIEGLLRAYLPFTATDEGLSPRFMTVLAAFALLAGALSGTVPALQGSRADLARHLRAGDKVIGQRAAFRNVLLIAQIALGLVLVVGAGMFVRSVQSFRQHLAYDLDRPLVAALDLRKAG
ncbi:MAG: FtsX-like permease family protein, partial [Vicinamibacterales bacterium]